MDLITLCKNLEIKGFKPIVFKSELEANSYISSIVGVNKNVGSGGSVTLKSIGILEILKKRNKIFHTDYMKELELTRDEIYDNASKADFYISSANAITMNGDIVNIDGRANRVSSLIYGIENIIYVIGTNKITKSLDEAISRIRNISSPLNTKRLKKKTPCSVTGKCSYCNSSDCICNVTTISHHPTSSQKNVYVIIIEKELGF